MTKSTASYVGSDLEAMASAPNYYRWVFSEIKSFLGTSTIVEAGAGSGNFLSLLLDAEAKEGSRTLIAIEPSVQMYSLLKRRFNGNERVRCEQGLFADVAPRYAGKFDTVLYINVLEHVEHDDVELETVYESLPVGGHVCIFVPALPFLYSRFDKEIGHYRRYTKRELEMRVRSAGFEIVKSRYFDIAGIIPWFVFIKLFRSSVTSGRAGLYDRVVVPLIRRIETYITPPIGKNVMVVGEKRTA